MRIVAKVQKLGRIAIPHAVRELYNLHQGDIIEFVITKVKHPDGTVVDFSASAQEGVAEKREVEA